MIQLSNEVLTIRISALGAELCGIKGEKTGTEYMWQADPTFWKRHSPILFPIVGSVWENRYKVDGLEYNMSQHGFARDMEFKLLCLSENEAKFSLEHNDHTLKVYPYPFRLEIGYKLEGNQIKVLWRVQNPSDKEIYFQIGAHPAFYYPEFTPGNNELGYFSFDVNNGLSYILIEQKGCVVPQKHPLQMENGLLPIDLHTFDQDALIFENSQLNQVHLLDKRKRPYITLEFTAPVVGLWSPPKKNAPFVCIEPWYGRCDRMNYAGEFKDRDWIQHLAAKDTFETSYTIIIERESLNPQNNGN